MNPARATSTDVDAALRSLDPEREPAAGAPAPGALDADTAHLAALRARIDAERAGAQRPSAIGVPARSGRSTQRRRAVAGLAVAAVAVGAVAVTHSVRRTPEFHPQLAAATLGANGELTCDGHGYADPIEPADAPLRLLPATMPPGWSLTSIGARASIGGDACDTPSLVAVATDDAGLVTGTLSVTGPVHADLGEGSDGELSQDSIGGHPARVFTVCDGAVPFERWLWSDDEGQQWEAEVSGYSPSSARAVVGAIVTSGTQVSLDHAGAPELRVEHQRTGEPYYGKVHSLDWYLNLSDGDRDRGIDVQHDTGSGHDVRTNLAQYAVVGAREVSLGGRPALVGPVRTGDEDGDGTSDPDETSVIVQVDARTLAWTSAIDDLPATEQLLTSLVDVPTDDPRLSLNVDTQ